MPSNRKTALVHQRVMRRAEQQQVFEIRLAAVGPVVHVMRIEIARVMAARERARPVAREYGFLQRAGYDALLAADVERPAGVVVHDRASRRRRNTIV